MSLALKRHKHSKDKSDVTGDPSTVTVPPLPLTVTVSVKGGAVQAAAGLVLMIVRADTSNRQVNRLTIIFFNIHFLRGLPVTTIQQHG
jgi:hypothetical protein